MIYFLYRNIGSMCAWALILVLISCKQDLPFPASTDPVFTASATLDEQQVAWQAGENDYVMATDWTLDVQNVQTFSGAFVGGKEGALSITLRDQKLAGNAFNAEEVLEIGTRFYLGQIDPTEPFTMAFQTSDPQHTDGKTYLWDFGDGNTSTLPNPKHTYQTEGLYEVKVTVTDAAGCTSISRQVVQTGQRYVDCGLDLNYEILDETNVKFQADYDRSLGNPVLVLTTGDGIHYAKQEVVTHTYEMPGIYEVKLVATFKSKGTCCVIKNIYTGSGASCISSTDFTRSSLPLDLGRVCIEYTDPVGRRYTSQRFESQPASSTFEVLSYEPYVEDAQGRPTYLISAQFNCELYAADDPDEVLILENGEAVFAVAVPD